MYKKTNIPLFLDSPSTWSVDVSMSMGVAGENNIITLLLIAIMLHKQRERWSQFSKQNVQFSNLQYRSELSEHRTRVLNAKG